MVLRGEKDLPDQPGVLRNEQLKALEEKRAAQQQQTKDISDEVKKLLQEMFGEEEEPMLWFLIFCMCLHIFLYVFTFVACTFPLFLHAF